MTSPTGGGEATRSRVTIVDVAKRAGVAIGTASDALNGRGRISEETRSHVTAVADELNYRPQANAKALRRGNTMSIGLRFGGGLVPQAEYAEFILDLVNGAATEAHHHGYGLLISAPELDEARVMDGLIVVDPTPDSRLEIEGLPIITIGQDVRRRAIPYVDVDFDVSVRLLGDHVAPYAPAGPAWLLNETTQASWVIDHASSLRQWCAEVGRDAVIIGCTDREESVAPALDLEMERAGPPAIVIAPSGQHADRAQRHLLERGIRVPEEVVVVSTLANSALRNASPPIPALDMDGWGHGRRAVEALVAWLASGTVPASIILSPHLADPLGKAIRR